MQFYTILKAQLEERKKEGGAIAEQVNKAIQDLNDIIAKGSG